MSVVISLAKIATTSLPFCSRQLLYVINTATGAKIAADQSKRLVAKVISTFKSLKIA